jgi:hypothetical protein
MQVRVNEDRGNIGSCGCGRSPSGKCCGWHGLSDTDYQKQLALYEERESRRLKTACYCYNCNKDVKVQGGIPYVATTMIVCPQCGNKRCPHSTDHNLACTNSNDPGQPGSRY